MTTILKISNQYSLSKTVMSTRNLFSNNKVVSKDPFKIFNQWYKDASQLGNAEFMYLTTVSQSCAPSCRMSTCIDFSEDGFKFAVNEKSQTGIELVINIHVALTFSWPSGRVVRVEGCVQKSSESERNNYIKGLSYDDKIVSKCSEYGKIFGNRHALTEYVNRIKLKYSPDSNFTPDVCLYIAVPSRIEFYQSKKGEPQERLQFNKDNTADNKLIYQGEKGWTYSILSP